MALTSPREEFRLIMASLGLGVSSVMLMSEHQDAACLKCSNSHAVSVPSLLLLLERDGFFLTLPPSFHLSVQLGPGAHGMRVSSSSWFAPGLHPKSTSTWGNCAFSFLSFMNRHFNVLLEEK